MPDYRSDGETIAASVEDPSRFAEIFDRYFDDVFRYVASRLGPSAAEDVAAEAFVVAFRRRASFDVSKPARPWLLGIATNLVHRHHRTEARRLAAYAKAANAEPIDHRGAGDEIEERVDAQDSFRRISSALAGLTPRDRDVLLLYAWEGLSYPEIADALGIPVGTVRSRLFRSRRTLRELLDPSGQHSQEVRL